MHFHGAEPAYISALLRKIRAFILLFKFSSEEFCFSHSHSVYLVYIHLNISHLDLGLYSLAILVSEFQRFGSETRFHRVNRNTFVFELFSIDE